MPSSRRSRFRTSAVSSRGVLAETARETVRRQDDLVVHTGPNKAQSTLTLVQPTLARAHIALDSAVIQRVPVPRGHSVRVVESDRVFHRGHLHNSTLRRLTSEPLPGGLRGVSTTAVAAQLDPARGGRHRSARSHGDGAAAVSYTHLRAHETDS